MALFLFLNILLRIGKASFDVVALIGKGAIEKMAKKTCPYCDGKKGRYESWGTHGKGWYKCNTCGGKGYIFVDEPRPQREPKKREDRPHQEPKQRRERQERQPKDSNWREKSCSAPGCYNTIRYHINWSNIPDLCEYHLAQKKAEWMEKPCKRSGCRNTIRYNVNWDHIPNFCKQCKEELQRLNQSFETSDTSYVMPGMGKTIGQMGGTKGKHYPRQGKIHCMVFEGMRGDDLHYSWDFDAVTGEIIGQVYMHPNNPKG